jgi:hypothetical protein
MGREPLNRALQHEIQGVIAEISQAWLNGRVDDLSQIFHEDMVIVGPDFQELSRGKASCVKSYHDFLAQAQVIDYRESEPMVDDWVTIAVATLPWEMTYELAGRRYKESGHDTFAFKRQDDRWQAVWRLMTVDRGK